MISYITGFLFIILHISFMIFVGNAFVPNKSGAYKFIIGYLIFSFCIAIGGIPIQLLNLPWIVFSIYVFIVYIGLFILSIWKLKFNKNNCHFKNCFFNYFNSYWCVYLVSILLTIVSILNIESLWLGNCMDDGFYISWVASLPFNENGFLTSPSTGFLVNVSDLFSYLCNTIYSEYSVYSYYFNIAPTVLCRVFMNFFNYFILASSICCVAEYIYSLTNKSIKNAQYTVIILFLLGLNHYYLVDNGLLNIYDGWQYNTAMYYGSSLIRVAGIFLFIIPFLESTKIGFREIGWFIILSIGLVSKSSIAFPFIIVISISYFMTHIIFNCRSKKKYTVFLTLSFIFIVSVLLENEELLENLILQRLVGNINSYFILFFGVFFVLSFILKTIDIFKINVLIINMFLMIFLPPFNNILENTSFFDFVAERVVTGFIYFFILISGIYVTIFIEKFIKKDIIKKVLYASMSGGLFFLTLVSFGFSFNNILSNAYIIYKNRYIFPNASIQLGEILEDRYFETEDINTVIMNEGVMANNYVHSIGTSLRTVTPHSISLSAIPRYGIDSYGDFRGMDKEVQSAFEYFTLNPSVESYMNFSQSIKGYPINTIIARSAGLDKFFKEDGFFLYDIVKDDLSNVTYYIYVR